MSRAYYEELWLHTRNQLERLLALEKSHQEAPALQDRRQILNFLLPIYLQYKNVLKNLVVCHDGIVQSQQRKLIKRFLDCSIGRMLEVRREVVNRESSEYTWPDDHMRKLKLTTDDLAIPGPGFTRGCGEARRKQLEELIDAIEKQFEDQEIDSEVPQLEEETTEGAKGRAARRKPQKLEEELKFLLETPEQAAERETKMAAQREKLAAILMLQSHERARVVRRIAADVKSQYDYKRKLARGMIIPKKVKEEDYERSVLKIQCVWRGFLARKALKEKREETEFLLGMKIRQRDEALMKIDRENFDLKLKLGVEHAAKLQEVIEEEKQRLLMMRAPAMVEEISDGIRQWFYDWYEKVKFFGPFPAEKQGGTVLIVTDEIITPEEFLKNLEESRKKIGKKEKQKEKQKEKAPEKKQVDEGWRMAKTKNLDCLMKANQEFLQDWAFRSELCLLDKRKVRDFYMDLIIGNVCHDLQYEMRKVADKQMTEEWNTLNEALNKLHKDDEPEWENPTWKKGKRKKGGTGKRSKKKKKATELPVEEYFNELVMNKIIRKYPPTYLKDWWGDLSYGNYEARLELREHSQRIGEVRQVIMEYCILPLSSKEAHQTATPLTKAVAILGPPQSGKSFLVNAICTEVGALLIDLSPEVLGNFYEKGGKPQELLAMINLVARLYAPTIVLVDPGEKPWLKKVTPEEESLQPKKFTKYIEKFVKGIKPGDQILFLTTSSEPYKATNGFLKIHNRFVAIPRSDYNSLYMLYKYVLLKYPGVDQNLDVSCLAKVSRGIPLRVVTKAVEETLCLRRRIALKPRPFSQLEILENLMGHKPDPKDVKQFEKFESKLPLNRKRVKLLKNEKAAQQQAAKAKALKKK